MQILVHCFTPSSDEFFADSWERKPLFIQRSNKDYYRELLTDRGLENIISHSDLRYPAIQLAKNGSFYPPAAHTRDARVGQLTLKGVANVGTTSAEYGKGSDSRLHAHSEQRFTLATDGEESL